MNDLLVALGLVLVIEGLLWAVSPAFGRRLLEVAAETPDPTLRLAGAFAAGLGVLVVWLVRG